MIIPLKIARYDRIYLFPGFWYSVYYPVKLWTLCCIRFVMRANQKRRCGVAKASRWAQHDMRQAHNKHNEDGLFIRFKRLRAAGASRPARSARSAAFEMCVLDVGMWGVVLCLAQWCALRFTADWSAYIFAFVSGEKKTKSSESKTIPYILNSLPCSWGPNKAISQTVFCAKQTVSVCVCVHEFICLSRVLRLRRRRRLKAACRFVVLHCLCWPTRDFGQQRRRRWSLIYLHMIYAPSPTPPKICIFIAKLNCWL